MIAWKVRRRAHPEAGELSADTQVFVAAGLGRTYQLTGQLRLTQAEAEDLEQRLQKAKSSPEPYSADLTAVEYNRLQQFLTEWAESDLEALYLAEMVRSRFGASARKRRGEADGTGEGAVVPDGDV